MITTVKIVTTCHISFCYRREWWSHSMSWHRWSMTACIEHDDQQFFDCNLSDWKFWPGRPDRSTALEAEKNCRLCSMRARTDDDSFSSWICTEDLSVKEHHFWNDTECTCDTRTRFLILFATISSHFQVTKHHFQISRRRRDKIDSDTWIKMNCKLNERICSRACRIDCNSSHKAWSKR